MRFFLLLLAVLVGIWLWRSNRRVDPKLKRQQARAAAPPQVIVRCALCAVHVPSGEAVQGKNGAYCSADHRHSAEA